MRRESQARETVFNHKGRRAWASINFVTAHDGFTLSDWATYNEKRNEANGEDNKDGSSSNRSWNCGVEGRTDETAINDLRNRQIRNMLATLLLSQGTPMLLAGDEFARTQHGNNNAYCQDSEISWVNWELDQNAARLLSFTKKVIALRRRYPALRRSRFLTGLYDGALGVRDLTWINANGAEMQKAHWEDGNTKCLGMLVDGRAQRTGIRKRGDDASVLIVMNSFEGPVDFALPKFEGGEAWNLLVDTNLDDAPVAAFAVGSKYQVTGRSLLLFATQAA